MKDYGNGIIVLEEEEEKLEQLVLASVKDSVGYYEAADKEAFLTGARIAFGRTLVAIDIEGLNHQLKREKAEAEHYLSQLKTLAEIIGQYKD